MAIAKRKPAEPVRIDLRKEDTVKVISGRDKVRAAACCASTGPPGKFWWST